MKLRIEAARAAGFYTDPVVCCSNERSGYTGEGGPEFVYFIHNDPERSCFFALAPQSQESD